jgi:hypothetical protein
MNTNTFDSKIHPEELFAVSESEHDEVMRLMAEESDGFTGYGDWSGDLEQPAASENFEVVNGRLRHRPEPRSIGRMNGYEL